MKRKKINNLLVLFIYEKKKFKSTMKLIVLFIYILYIYFQQQFNLPAMIIYY